MVKFQCQRRSTEYICFRKRNLPGLMVIVIKAATRMIKKMVKAFIIGLMNMTANGEIIDEIKKIYIKFMFK
jgi:hypothetical protein